MAGAAAFSVQQSSRAGKEMATWQRQSGKSKLSIIQDILENKKPGILFPVLKEMKKELNNQGLSTKQPKHSSPASFLEVLQAGLHLCVQGLALLANHLQKCCLSNQESDGQVFQKGSYGVTLNEPLYLTKSLESLFLLWQKKILKNYFVENIRPCYFLE